MLGPCVLSECSPLHALCNGINQLRRAEAAGGPGLHQTQQLTVVSRVNQQRLQGRFMKKSRRSLKVEQHCASRRSMHTTASKSVGRSSEDAISQSSAALTRLPCMQQQSKELDRSSKDL